MIKKLLVVVVLVLAAVVLFGCGDEGSLPDGAVAKVGETVITQEEFDVRMEQVIAQLKEQAPSKDEQPEEYADLEARVLDYLVTLEISRQKQDELGVTVADEDIQAQIDQIKQMFQGDEAKYQEALAGEGLTEEQLRQNIEEQLLIKGVAEAAAKDVEVSDEELQAYYDEHADEFQQPETRTARHILFAPGGSVESTATPTDADWEAALAEAEKVRKEILDGADFAAEAEKYSDDTGSAQQGGSLGQVQPGMMVPEFDKALFGLKKDEISQPVKTQYGYHLIQVQDITQAGQMKFEDVKEQIRTKLLDERKTEAWMTWLDEQRAALGVVIKPGMETTTTTTPEATDSESTETTESSESAGSTESTEADASTTTTAQ